MVRLNDHGVADVLAIAFMFILLVLGAVLMHAYSLRPLRAAADRQLELKCEHLYKTLETAWVEPYSISFLRAAADNLVLENPIVPNAYLRTQMFAVVDYLRPPSYGVSVALSYDGRTWGLICPENSINSGKEIIRWGRVSVTKAGGEKVIVDVTVRFFEMP
jgi:hypothetical protein